jgi:calcium permeable stress-gated cation channel
MSINPAKANAGTTETFLTSLVTNAGLLTFQVAVFVYLKQHLGRIYTPRTYLPPPEYASDIC